MWVWAKELGGRVVYIEFEDVSIAWRIWEAMGQEMNLDFAPENESTLKDDPEAVAHLIQTHGKSFLASGPILEYKRVVTWSAQQGRDANGQPVMNIGATVNHGATGMPNPKGGIDSIAGEVLLKTEHWVEFAIIDPNDPGFLPIREAIGDTKIMVASPDSVPVGGQERFRGG